MKLPKGVYEKVPGSNVFGIRYADGAGRIRREKAGTKSAAVKLYQKRKTEVLHGKKFPETLRSRSVTFSDLGVFESIWPVPLRAAGALTNRLRMPKSLISPDIACHTFASRLVMAGVNLRTVQELMGHKTIQMTVR